MKRWLGKNWPSVVVVLVILFTVGLVGFGVAQVVSSGDEEELSEGNCINLCGCKELYHTAQYKIVVEGIGEFYTSTKPSRHSGDPALRIEDSCYRDAYGTLHGYCDTVVWVSGTWAVFDRSENLAMPQEVKERVK